MKSVIISKNGGPEVLELKNVSLDNPGAKEVLIKNEAIGLNYIDTYHRSGLYPVELPSNIGIEGAGIIEKVGSEVNDFKVGDRVAYASMPIGSYSTHRIFPTQKLVRVPDEIDFKNVVTLMTKGFTVFYLLHKTYKVKSGETILFHAAAGGVGQIFCQWAKSLGCKVIGTVGSDEKIKIAKSNGCDHVINYTKENFAEKVKEITNGLGVSVVYDGVGKKTFDQSIECLKVRGMMVSFGNASGPLDPCNVTKSLAPKGLYLTRPSIAHYTSTTDELNEAANKVFEMYITKKFKLDIFKEYSLDNIVQAHQDLENRKILGPAIIIP
tara:strand:- start:3615 stop:4586 length:972 start_codon:yes stop_codon:yes gene_type:complete